MKKIKLRALVRGRNGEWIEEFAAYVTDDVSEYAYMITVMNNYNCRLRPTEFPRYCIMVRPLKNTKARIAHDWVKGSLVTEKGGYDRYICNRCGHTGKRYGLNSGVVVDKGLSNDCTWIP